MQNKQLIKNFSALKFSKLRNVDTVIHTSHSQDVVEICARARARARVCVCVCVCVHM